MPNEIRTRQNFLGGLVENNPLAPTATTLNSGALITAVVIDSTKHMPLILDPDGVFGEPEIVWITAHAFGSTAATILRGQEGTTARQHNRDTPWLQAPTTRDFQGGGDSSWINATYQNSWTTYDTTFAPARYRKDALGFVHIQGMIRSGSGNAAIFTLPVGYRPNWRLLIDVQSAGALGRVDIYTTGEVWFVSGSGTWMSLDNISFFADQ